MIATTLWISLTLVQQIRFDSASLEPPTPETRQIESIESSSISQVFEQRPDDGSGDVVERNASGIESFADGLDSLLTPFEPGVPVVPEVDAISESGSWLARRRISVSGWTDGSFTASTARREQNPMGMNYLANQFLLQQNWLRIDRPVETDSGLPSFGFRSDTILPGSDYLYTRIRGLADEIFVDGKGIPARYGIDPVQFWAEGYFPEIGQGLSLKLGRFFAPFGVESIAAADSPLPSRSYTFIYDPFTQTGLLGNLQLENGWSVKSGIIMGNDVFVNAAASPYYVGGFRYDPNEGRSTAEFTIVFGSGDYNQTLQFNNPQIFDLVFTHRLSDSITWNADLLYGFQNDVPSTGFANWFGIVNYLTVDWSDSFATIGRAEFFDDLQGQRTGHSGLYTAITAGARYEARKWLWIRPEIRLDYNRSAPFEGSPTLFTATLDVIFRW